MRLIYCEELERCHLDQEESGTTCKEKMDNRAMFGGVKRRIRRDLQFLSRDNDFPAARGTFFVTRANRYARFRPMTRCDAREGVSTALRPISPAFLPRDFLSSANSR